VIREEREVTRSQKAQECEQTRGKAFGARWVMAPTYTQRVQENHVYASTVLYCVAAAALGGAAAAVLPL